MHLPRKLALNLNNDADIGIFLKKKKMYYFRDSLEFPFT